MYIILRRTPRGRPARRRQTAADRQTAIIERQLNMVGENMVGENMDGENTVGKHGWRKRENMVGENMVGRQRRQTAADRQTAGVLRRLSFVRFLFF